MSELAVAVRINAVEAMNELTLAVIAVGILMRRSRVAIDAERLKPWRYFR